MPRLFVSVGPDDAGLAVARALRQGLPDHSLVAVSRAPHGPALEADVFDETRTVPAWDALDPAAHAADLTRALPPGDLFLPTHPTTTHWLADAVPQDPSLLAPSPSGLAQTTGPSPDAASSLPASAPASVPLTAPVEQVHAFGRRHGWSLWLRGPLGGRHAVGHWNELEAARTTLTERTGPTDALVLQRRVKGTPIAISFAADGGTVFDAALVRPLPGRRDTFEARPLSAEWESALHDLLGTLGWTGGGRLDLIETDDGTRWLDTWRPCFGGEVEGLARCGANLPAELLAARRGEPVAPPEAPASSFSSGAAEADDRRASAHPSPPLPTATRPTPPDPALPLTDALRAIVDDLPTDPASGDTPRSVLLPTRTQDRFEAFADAADRLENAFGLDAARVGLSIKTNPADRLLATARATGMLAETIHPSEMAHARQHGYDTSEIIVNGPVQALLPHLDTAPYAVFGDALTDLDDLPFDPSDTIVGVRTRPPERGPSRFGVDLSDAEAMTRLCRRLSALPDSTRIGLHLHAPASTLGHDRWWASLDRVLTWARTIQERTGRPVEGLDLGGGWHPDDWLDVFVPGLLDRREHIRDALPGLDTLLLEPGKALSQPLGVVMSRVLDARPSRNEVILDASLAELSNIDYHPHRLLARTDDRGWHRLPRGTGRLLGRLCMEADILGRRRQVDHLSPGDLVVVCDAGAYDASMTYPFGRGQTAA